MRLLCSTRSASLPLSYVLTRDIIVLAYSTLLCAWMGQNFLGRASGVPGQCLRDQPGHGERPVSPLQGKSDRLSPLFGRRAFVSPSPLFYGEHIGSRVRCLTSAVRDANNAARFHFFFSTRALSYLLRLTPFPSLPLTYRILYPVPCTLYLLISCPFPALYTFLHVLRKIFNSYACWWRAAGVPYRWHHSVTAFSYAWPTSS